MVQGVSFTSSQTDSFSCVVLLSIYPYLTPAVLVLSGTMVQAVSCTCFQTDPFSCVVLPSIDPYLTTGILVLSDTMLQWVSCSSSLTDVFFVHCIAIISNLTTVIRSVVSLAMLLS